MNGPLCDYVYPWPLFSDKRVCGQIADAFEHQFASHDRCPGKPSPCLYHPFHAEVTTTEPMLRSAVTVRIEIEHAENLDVTSDVIAKFAAQGVQDNLGSFEQVFVKAGPSWGSIARIPIDPITKSFLDMDRQDGTGEPTILKPFRVCGQDILAINAMDFEGFAIRTRRHSGLGWTVPLGNVSTSVDTEGNRTWTAKPPKPSDFMSYGMRSAVEAVKYLLGYAGVI